MNSLADLITMDLLGGVIRSTEGSIRKLCEIRDRRLALGEDVKILNHAIRSEGVNLKHARLVRLVRRNKKRIRARRGG